MYCNYNCTLYPDVLLEKISLYLTGDSAFAEFASHPIVLREFRKAALKSMQDRAIEERTEKPSGMCEIVS